MQGITGKYSFHLFLKALSFSRPRVVNGLPGVVEFSTYRHIPEVSHWIVEFSAQIHGIDHHARTICPELADNHTVRLDETRWIGRIISARIRPTHREIIRRRPALHCLPHYVRMDAGAFLPGVIEGLENDVEALLVKCSIQLR